MDSTREKIFWKKNCFLTKVQIEISSLLTVFLSIPLNKLPCISQHYGKVALIHVDAHSDTAEHQGHFDLTHGTPFRRAVEDDLLDNTKVFQIGIRG